MHHETTSRITGTPVVVVITGHRRPSRNPKTGPMTQSWVLSPTHNPLRARELSVDRAYCGACSYRNGSCYVQWHRAPLAAWHRYKCGGTAPLDPQALAGRPLRIGSAGDPTALPAWWWRLLSQYATHHTGYTHRWLAPENDDFRPLIMASVHSPEERDLAWRMGWRTFRDHAPGKEERRRGEVRCPASKEAGHRKTCATCGWCSGADGSGPRGVVIVTH